MRRCLWILMPNFNDPLTAKRLIRLVQAVFGKSEPAEKSRGAMTHVCQGPKELLPEAPRILPDCPCVLHEGLWAGSLVERAAYDPGGGQTALYRNVRHEGQSHNLLKPWVDSTKG